MPNGKKQEKSKKPGKSLKNRIKQENRPCRNPAHVVAITHCFWSVDFTNLSRGISIGP